MSMENDEPSQLDSLILGEIQVLLSEKRTALSSMRTGIAVVLEKHLRKDRYLASLTLRVPFDILDLRLRPVAQTRTLSP
jgi:hypothetical protein